LIEAVVDASSIGAFLLPDEGGAMAERVHAVAADSLFRVPPHWPLEVMSLILKAQRQRRITVAQRDLAHSAALILFQAARIEATVPAAAVVEIALRYNISIYDAAYLELAKRHELALLTGDGPLRGAATRASVKVLA
jgi:predicted nucleic acid-binding protein